MNQKELYIAALAALIKHTAKTEAFTSTLTKGINALENLLFIYIIYGKTKTKSEKGKKSEPQLFHCLRMVSSLSRADFSSVAYIGVA